MKYVTIELTKGNLRNSHLYLASVISFFPPNSIGGSNKSTQASQLLEVHSGISHPVNTDIAGDKKIFRQRSWVREFFEVHELKAGEKVVIEKTGEYRFHVFPART